MFAGLLGHLASAQNQLTKDRSNAAVSSCHVMSCRFCRVSVIPSNGVRILFVGHLLWCDVCLAIKKN